MYEFIRLEAAQSLEQAPLFKHLTPSHLHSCFSGQDPSGISDTAIFAIGVLHDCQPVGILLASHYLHLHRIKLHFIYTTPEHRNQHLATRMLQSLQESAQKASVKTYLCSYQQEDPYTPALEKVLTACRWKTGHPYLIECLYESAHFDPTWIHTPYTFPPSLEEFPWKELSQKDREQIMADERRGVIPYAVFPFREEQLIEPLNSLGLRHEGRVIGWIITHRIAPDTIVYQSLYIERSFHFQGPGIKLLIDSMLIHKKLAIKWAIFKLPLEQTHPAWIHFVKRRLIPYADRVTHHLQAWKEEEGLDL